MKKLFKKRLFLVLSAGIVIMLLVGLYLLKANGIINLPTIEHIRLYKNVDFALGAPEFFHLPTPYSRFWDFLLLPTFLSLLLWSGKKVYPEANPWILGIEMIIIIVLAYFFSSGIFSLYAGALFAAVCGLSFGEWTAIFMSLFLGLIIGLIAFGLLFGLIIGLIAFGIFLGLKQVLS